MSFHCFLSVHRRGNDVCIRVDSGLSVERPIYVFSFNMQGEAGAELMSRHLSGKLADLVQKANRDAYEAGYADGRAKRAKRGWHTCAIGWDG